MFVADHDGRNADSKLKSSASDWKQATLARDFIAALRAGSPADKDVIDGRSMMEWLDWAEARAAAMDPMRGTAAPCLPTSPPSDPGLFRSADGFRVS